jgi:4-hydroxythreonine-4-phosphate dehydrogenase
VKALSFAGPAPEFVDVGGAPADVVTGTATRAGGEIAVLSIQRAVADALAGRTTAIVTGPISKEAMNLAGYAFSGHTELLADLAGTPGTCMMLVHGALRVSHVTTHVALARVPSLVTPARVDRVIGITVDALARFGIARPRIAVAALNPHAGEGGLFGTEDAEVLVPAVAAWWARGIAISGPLPGDTVFVRALAGEFDAVVAMFHDQGHIPVKLLGFKVDKASGRWSSLSGVNITLGLPFVRTSVDHGTAFDIAGKGIAAPQSMIEAIELALALATSGATQLPG